MTVVNYDVFVCSGGDAGISMFPHGRTSSDSAPPAVSRTLPLSLCAPGTALDQVGRSRPTLPLSIPLTSTMSLTDLHSPMPNVAGQNPLSLAFFPSTGATQLPTISASGLFSLCECYLGG